MSRIHRRDTGPELVVRRLLFAQGTRYRVDYLIKGVGHVDIAFPKRRVAIFIDGCYWHGCPEHGATPKTNLDYWLPKIQRNRTRDEKQTAALRDLGWTVIRIWEHEVRDNPALAIARILSSLTPPYASGK